MGKSFFNGIAEAPSDAIFQLTAAFNADPRLHKVNLSVGLYRDESLQTPILESVKAAEHYLISHEITKEYLPIAGDPLYIEESGRLIFGDKLWTAHRERICGIQTPGGTGGLRIGGELLRQDIGSTIAIPDPTWPNHSAIFKQCGLSVHLYPYYDPQSHSLDLDSIFEMLQNLPPRSAALFHACCHNPTGADPSEKTWNELMQLIQEKEALLFFDFAYQGFGQGLDEDAYAIRLAVQKGLECVVASSYSKNFGLYSERVGTLFAVAENEIAARHVLSKLKVLARTSYSNPPRHGSAIVAHILSTPSLRKQWSKEVDSMRDRLNRLRKTFVLALQSGRKKIDFSYLLDRAGMFCFVGLEKDKVRKLQEEYGIYMTSDGRINLAGLSGQNLPYVVESMLKFL